MINMGNETTKRVEKMREVQRQTEGPGLPFSKLTKAGLAYYLRFIRRILTEKKFSLFLMN